MTYGKADKGQGQPDTVADEALDWFLRLQEDHSPETLQAFETWESSRHEHKAAFDGLVRMQTMGSLYKATEADRERQIKDCRTTSVGRHARRFSPLRLGAFSAVAIVFAVVISLQLPGVMLRWNADYLTVTGERQTITLPDGSLVTLNTSSAIAVHFNDDLRRVTLLEGEAYFDVKHDPAHPFVVASKFSEVEVKGTAFAVQTDDSKDIVSLERGRVEVTRINEKSDRATLEPGQTIEAGNGGLSAVTATDIPQSLAWRDGGVVFRDRQFGDALPNLQRYFGGRVLVMSDRFAAKRVSGNYRIDEPEAAIRTLAASVGATVTSLPGGILILR